MTPASDGRVTALFTAPSKGRPMVAHESVSVREGGLDGDRYYRGSGYYSGTDGCQVTLVDAAVLSDARREFGVDLSEGRHRRNVVVRGIDPTNLLDATFQLGGATLRGTRLRPPCAYLAELVGDDEVGDALRERRGGICARVVSPGEVHVGDAVRVTEASPRVIGRQIAARLGGTDADAGDNAE